MIYPYITAPPADFNEILPNTRAGITDKNFVTLITSRDFCYNMAGDTPMASSPPPHSRFGFYGKFLAFYIEKFPH